MEMKVNRKDLLALAQFRAAMRRFLRFSESAARAAGLTPQQHQMMLATKLQPDRDWVTLSEIAESLQINHNAAVGLVNRAEKAGLVSRSLHASDRRCVCVAVTEQGEAVLTALSAKHKRELEQISPVFQRLLATFLGDSG